MKGFQTLYITVTYRSAIVNEFLFVHNGSGPNNLVQFLVDNHSDVIRVVAISHLMKTACTKRKESLISLNHFQSHLNRDQIEYSLSLPGILGRHEKALFISFETSPFLI